jgi:hypothetical protein
MGGIRSARLPEPTLTQNLIEMDASPKESEVHAHGPAALER